MPKSSVLRAFLIQTQPNRDAGRSRSHLLLIFAAVLALGIGFGYRWLADGGGKTVFILGIGNSFSVDTMNEYVAALAAADGIRVVVARGTVGGATLDEHVENARRNEPVHSYSTIGGNGSAVTVNGIKLDEALRDQAWDIVCFQQQSWLAGQFASYEQGIPWLVAYAGSRASNADALFALLQT